ncbi:MAG: OadG family protein [Verrucomicrobiota bacterium JB025]
MMMMTIGFDLDNIVKSDGVAISITGMSIVFLGLAMVSVMIFWLPRVLEMLDGLRSARAERDGEAEEPEDESNDGEIAVAIVMVLQDALTPEDGSALQRITIRRRPEDAKWKIFSQLHTLSTHVPMRKVQR